MKKTNRYLNLILKIILFILAYMLASINTDNPNKIVYYVCLLGVAGAAYVLTEEFSSLSKSRNTKRKKK